MAEIDFITQYDSRSPISEAYRSIRTNLQFSGVGQNLKVVAFTSVLPNEGKSTTVANLAIVMGQDNKKVLLIDCDLRKPVQHRRFELPNKGLTNCFAENISLHQVIQKNIFPNLDIVTCGPIPPNPAELLGSSRMMDLLEEVDEDYDYIFLDMPPVLVVTDAAIMGSKVDGVVLVLASGEVSPEEARQAKSLLEKGKANILGAVLNKIPYTHRHSHYYYYYYDQDHVKHKHHK
ncbi:CpsD/CapB family tyrosine-protein kinase [uncultured Megasphaera sp.]|uniref:CpsD/CapB family tyrosine-protein kinase n=1 Tax=uncultured Megasphaera sp. TaxID=165188 RepID=UPI0025D7CEFF|nr:CpsD/CapB family tyrosine-protein kinase [uncultured Megasphaera sp.]